MKRRRGYATGQAVLELDACAQCGHAGTDHTTRIPNPHGPGWVCSRCWQRDAFGGVLRRSK